MNLKQATQTMAAAMLAAAQTFTDEKCVARTVSQQTISTRGRIVGWDNGNGSNRNKPCPCGSGKKRKACKCGTP